jgi:hypothetical protein
MHRGGGDDARDVTVVMTANDPYITIIQDTAGPSLIPSGGMGTPQPEFEFTVAPGAPDYHEFMLDFEISTPSGYSTCEDIALLVGATTLEEDFEGSGTDWTHYNVTNGFVDEWHVESTSGTWRPTGRIRPTEAGSSEARAPPSTRTAPTGCSRRRPCAWAPRVS